MIRILLILTLLTLYTSTAKSADIQAFNTNVLGKEISSSISLLELTDDNNIHSIKPKVIQVDVNDGKYSASSIYYSAEEISSEQIIEYIDKKYPGARYKNVESENFLAWRINKEQFVISFSNQIEDGMYRLMYVKYFEWR